jgi:hypothetical protein
MRHWSGMTEYRSSSTRHWSNLTWPRSCTSGIWDAASTRSPSGTQRQQEHSNQHRQDHQSLMEPCPGQYSTTSLRLWLLFIDWTSCEKAIHLLIILQGHVADIIHTVPARATYEDIIGAVKGCYGDHQLTSLNSRPESSWAATHSKSLQQPSSSWHTGPISSCLWTSSRGKPPMHSLTEWDPENWSSTSSRWWQVAEQGPQPCP